LVWKLNGPSENEKENWPVSLLTGGARTIRRGGNGKKRAAAMGRWATRTAWLDPTVASSRRWYLDSGAPPPRFKRSSPPPPPLSLWPLLPPADHTASHLSLACFARRTPPPPRLRRRIHLQEQSVPSPRGAVEVRRRSSSPFSIDGWLPFLIDFIFPSGQRERERERERERIVIARVI